MSAAVPALSVEIRKRFSGGEGNFELNAEFSVPHGISILFGPSGAGIHLARRRRRVDYP